MIKMTMLLRRNPALTHEQFVTHHIEKHGPLFRQIPEAKQHVLRYLQTHPMAEKTSAVTVNDFDGTAELWFDNLAGLEAVLTSSFYKTKVWPDELTFLDHAHTLVTIGYQDDIINTDRQLKQQYSMAHHKTPDGHLAAITELKPKAGFEKAVFDAAAQIQQAASQEPGCLEFVLSTKQDEPTTMVLFELFRDQAALQSHQQQPHTEHFSRQIADKVDANDVTFLTPLAIKAHLDH